MPQTAMLAHAVAAKPARVRAALWQQQNGAKQVILSRAGALDAEVALRSDGNESDTCAAQLVLSTAAARVAIGIACFCVQV